MGCGSSNAASATSQSLPTLPSPDNNNASNFTGKKVTEKQLHSASQEINEAAVDKRTANVRVQKDSCDAGTKTGTKSRELTILHFNDVYNIEPREKEPVGGAARFATKVASFRHVNPMIVFSGDCLNPSTMSSVTGGKQMIPILNALNVNIAVFGNHDFDFGVDELVEFSGATNCPWLLSNVIDNITHRQLADGEVKRIIEWGGRKIGFIGLVEEEWLATLATVDREEVTYLDFVTEGTRLAKELREEGAEFVVALTHMRGPNDRRLAEQATGIDLILGGHDHDYFSQKINGVQVVKSGTDFRELSCITVSFNDDNTFSLDVKRIEITSDITEDPEVKLTVGVMKDMMEEVIGEVEVELDGRFSSMRTKETNLGNFVTDIIKNVTEVDCVILNSGTLRSDTIHPPGKFKMKDLSAILPMPDVLVVLQLTGDQILQALENGVSQWPKLEGRFPQVAGMTFSFNSKQDPGSRILENTVTINNKPLDKNKNYKVCTKSYLAKGKDGYQVFTKAKVLVDEEDGPILSTIVRNHFRSISIVRGVTKSKSSHRQSLIMRHRSSMIDDEGRRSSQEFFLNLEKEHTCIAPQVEGRITRVDGVTNIVDSESRQEILLHSMQVQQTETEDLSKVDKSVVESDNSLPVKSVDGDTQPIKKDEGENEAINSQKATESTEESTKDIAGKERPPLTDEPAVQEFEQNSKNMDKEQIKGHDEQISCETANVQSKKCQEQDNQVTEEIKGNDEQGSQELHKENSNEPPSKVEDKTTASPPQQEMDDALQQGPDLATEDEYWDLWEAVKVDNIDVVKNLREKKNIRFLRFQDKKTILHLGAERNAKRVVTYLLTEGKLDPNIKDEILQGVPLHGAAEYGSVDAARVLLEHGAEINKQDLIGNTALHIACEHEQGEMKTFLVDQGADTTVVNSDGEVPSV